MTFRHPLDRTIVGEYPPIRSEEDIRAIESVPLAERLAVSNTYDAIRGGTLLDPEKPAICFLPQGDPEEAPHITTHGQLLERIHQTANMLHDLGVGPTDVVSYLLPLVPQAYYILFGTQAVGIINAVNPMLEVGQIAGILKSAGTSVLVAFAPHPGTDIWEKAMAVRRELPGLKAVLQVGGPGDEADGVYGYDDLVRGYPGDRLVSGREIRPDDIVSYFHTGGTTGLPKLARHTHANQVYNVWACAMMFGARPENTFLAGLPMFHVTGAIGGLYRMACGQTDVLMSPAGFRNPAVVRNYWRLVERYRASVVFGVPTVLSALLSVSPDGNDLSSLNHTITGASTVPVEVARAMEARTGKPTLEIYGMTEATGLTHCAPRDGAVRLGSTGLRVPYSEVKTVRLDGEGRYAGDCGPDEIGAIAIRGPHIFPGYVEEAQNKGAFLGDGWLNSGDLGRIDAEGFLWVTGRAKDVIIRGGHNIDPLVIEDALHQHPAVELAAAVGQPDTYAGELPVAYVKLREGEAVEPEALLAFAREHIPERAANPVALFLVPEIPMTLVGKIFKPELRWDAARRVVEDVLGEFVPPRVDLGIHVGPDAVHGTTVAVTLGGGGDLGALEDRVRNALAPFGFHHTVTRQA